MSSWVAGLVAYHIVDMENAQDLKEELTDSLESGADWLSWGFSSWPGGRAICDRSLILPELLPTSF
jgi:hypothetical protein